MENFRCSFCNDVKEAKNFTLIARKPMHRLDVCKICEGVLDGIGRLVEAKNKGRLTDEDFLLQREPLLNRVGKSTIGISLVG